MFPLKDKYQAFPKRSHIILLRNRLNWRKQEVNIPRSPAALPRWRSKRLQGILDFQARAGMQRLLGQYLG